MAFRIGIIESTAANRRRGVVPTRKHHRLTPTTLSTGSKANERMEITVKSINVKRIGLTTALSLLVGIAPVGSAFATSPTNTSAVARGVGYVNTRQGSDGKIAGFAGVSDWAAIAYEAAGTDPATVIAPGGASLVDYLQANPPAAGAPATDYERDILAITAAGLDPYLFGGTNYVSALVALHTGGQIGSATAVNDDFFGVLALVAAHVSNTDSALTDALSFTLAHQHADGGFSYSTDAATGSDVDDTAATLMALHSADAAGLTVDAQSISNAKAYLLSTKNADGGFPYDPNTPIALGGPVSNVASTSWAVMALNALGDGSSADNKNARTFLRSQQQTDGSFPYTAPGAGDTSNTANAVTALSCGFFCQHVYDRPLPEGDVLGEDISPSPSVSPSPSPSPEASPSPDPSASPQVGAVLGASTGPGSGSTSNGSLLPVTGVTANQLTLLLAGIVSLAAATVAYVRTRRHKIAQVVRENSPEDIT